MARLFHINVKNCHNLRLYSTESADALNPRKSKLMKLLFGAGAALVGGTIVLGYKLEQTGVKATDLVVHSHKMPWFHAESIWHGYDVRSVRRGYQVYKQVCAACHSLDMYAYRHFVGQIMTEDEAKAEAAEIMVEDGPNDAGLMFTRPGRLNDQLPKPYKNEVQAKLANNMAIPPPLMLITLARHGGEDYLFHLLTGYQEAPAGIELAAGQAYNPYFPNGSVLSMAQQLYDDMLTYEDGTPATMSQMAKDVSTFLKYLAEPELPDRKKMAIKLAILTIPLSFLLLYYKRFMFSTWKTQKFIFRKVKGREPPPSASEPKR